MVKLRNIYKNFLICPNRKPLGRPRGFALVATLLLMILLFIMAIGLLSLSAITMRSSSREMAQAEAQANARMALMIAIGELQKYAGSDTRITASADILDPENPPLTGVWKSWEGSDHQTTGILTGRPIKPDYASKEKAITENGRFLAWLVSGTNPKMTPDQAKDLVTKTATSTSIAFVAGNSMPAGDDRQVHVEPVMVSDRGAFAWWVSGENQKAHVPKPYQPKMDNAASWSDNARSHAVADPEVFGLESLLIDPSPAQKAFSRNTSDFFANDGAPNRPSLSFHDISATSYGLLTNTATGGWRKDLSLLTEKWTDQPLDGRLPLFQLTPTQHLTYTHPTPGDFARPGSLFYAWSDYRAQVGGAGGTFHRRGSVTSWTSLANYATLYKQLNSSATGVPWIATQSWTYGQQYNGLHRTWIMPQIARMQIIVSHYATDNGVPGKLRPAVFYTPVITLWNPFNVEIRLPSYLNLKVGYTMPIALRYSLPSAVASNNYWAVQGPQTGTSYPGRRITDWHYGWNLRITGTPGLSATNPLILKPGETRVFSPAVGVRSDQTYVAHNNGQFTNMDLIPGVRNGVGFYYGLDRILQPGVTRTNINPDTVSLPSGTSLSPAAKFDVAAQKTSAGDVCGQFFQWQLNNSGIFADGNVTAHYRPQDADTLYPPLLGLASTTLAECKDNPVPFMSMIFGSRLTNHKATPTKGMVQGNPLVTFTATGNNDYFADIYPGGENLINSPWDFSFFGHTSGPGDDMLPNVDNSTNSGYIITGVRKADGVSRMVMTDLPLRPMVSLAELTHWHLRGLNPTPPHGQNLIANSDASPLIAMDDVVNPNNPHRGFRRNEQQDDSYCANHMLFDDWFFSSIAPEPTNFGPAGQSLKDNYIQFLLGKDPLANRAYRPILEDAVTDAAVAEEIHAYHVEPLDSWRTIASRLEVEGMFNVNSTSVRAWRALLGHARNQKIPNIAGGAAINLSAETDHAVVRTSIAGDAKAGTTNAGSYFATTEFTGYRVLDDAFLDALAEEVVRQVRERGPFLSLSEFVNRQLSLNKDLAVAGAIQAALNEVAKNSSTNPFDVLQNESIPSDKDPAGRDDYVFGEAAVGHNTYGLPGWMRQADILRPIAPILSVRDDTFTVRAYGDSRSANGKIMARAWCEATVRRTRNFCDTSEAPDIATAPTTPTNRTYGRQFEIFSFRWLTPEEL